MKKKKLISLTLSLIMALTIFGLPQGARAEEITPDSPFTTFVLNDEDTVEALWDQGQQKLTIRTKDAYVAEMDRDKYIELAQKFDSRNFTDGPVDYTKGNRERGWYYNSSFNLVFKKGVCPPSDAINFFSDFAGNLSLPDDFDVSRVSSFGGWFRNFKGSFPDISKWDVSHAGIFEHMFAYVKQEIPDISKWNPANAFTLAFMFENTENVNPDVSNWNISNGPSLEGMFYKSKSANPDVSKWDVRNVKNISNMFFDAKGVKHLDISKWHLDNVQNDRVFQFINFSKIKCFSYRGGTITGGFTSKTTGTINFDDDFIYQELNSDGSVKSTQGPYQKGFEPDYPDSGYMRIQLADPYSSKMKIENLELKKTDDKYNVLVKWSQDPTTPIPEYYEITRLGRNEIREYLEEVKYPQMTFLDKTAEMGQRYTYYITAKNKCKGIDYGGATSEGAVVFTNDFPEIKLLSCNMNKDMKPELKWSIGDGTYTKVNLYRLDADNYYDEAIDPLLTFDKYQNVRSYVDKTAVPGQAYAYFLSTSIETEGYTYESDYSNRDDIYLAKTKASFTLNPGKQYVGIKIKYQDGLKDADGYYLMGKSFPDKNFNVKRWIDNDSKNIWYYDKSSSKGNYFTYSIRPYKLIGDYPCMGPEVRKSIKFFDKPTISVKPRDKYIGTVISWNKVEGAKGYTVMIWSKSKKKYVRLADIENGKSYFVHTKASSVYKNFYRVRPYNRISGKTLLGPRSDEAWAIGSNPTKLNGVTAQAQPRKAGKGAVISWTKDTNASGYTVLVWSRSKKQYVRLADVKNGKLYYVHDKASAKVKNFYRVRSYVKYNGKTYLGPRSDEVSCIGSE